MPLKIVIPLGLFWGFYSVMLLGFGFSERLDLGSKIEMFSVGLPGFLTAETFSILNIKSPSLAMPVSMFYGVLILFAISKLLKKLSKSKK